MSINTATTIKPVGPFSLASIEHFKQIPHTTPPAAPAPPPLCRRFLLASLAQLPNVKQNLGCTLSMLNSGERQAAILAEVFKSVF